MLNVGYSVLGHTGFFFGTTGGSIALSPVGKVSGAHINPAVTLAFRLMGKLDLQTILMGDELRRTQGGKNEKQRQ
jgi:glycerol uptake facilitator-like aquaporin